MHCWMKFSIGMDLQELIGLVQINLDIYIHIKIHLDFMCSLVHNSMPSRNSWLCRVSTRSFIPATSQQTIDLKRNVH